MKFIAVLLTVHNRKDQTLSCLKTIFKQRSNCNFLTRIYLTDDGCTDGTAEAVSTAYPQVAIVKGNGNLFWNRGMHLAWKEASKSKCDYYLWLNDDTILYDDAINGLLETASHHPKSIIVGSTCDKNGNLSYGGRKSNRKHTVIPPDRNHAIPCDTFNGNIVLIPGNVVNRIGINDPYFHHSFGDIEYGLRAKKAGIVSYIAPGYYGTCERNNPVPLFRRKCYPLVKRYKFLYSPLGFNPIEDFHMNLKYYPIWKCILWFIKLHLNVLFPKDHTKYQK